MPHLVHRIIVKSATSEKLRGRSVFTKLILQVAEREIHQILEVAQRETHNIPNEGSKENSEENKGGVFLAHEEESKSENAQQVMLIEHKSGDGDQQSNSYTQAQQNFIDEFLSIGQGLQALSFVDVGNELAQLRILDPKLKELHNLAMSAAEQQMFSIDESVRQMLEPLSDVPPEGLKRLQIETEAEKLPLVHRVLTLCQAVEKSRYCPTVDEMKLFNIM